MSKTLSEELIPSTPNKNSLFMTSITIFKCAVGLGIMTNPTFFAQSGWLLGSIIIILISYLVAYNMVLLADVVQYIEDKNPNCDLSQMEDCLEYVIDSPKLRKVLFISKIY